ncbi:MAG: hypothetical protein MJZ67_02045, partial [Bacteroidales bacterium]|nr:hypothetical protein [Bacteroidales bacterium]
RSPPIFFIRESVRTPFFCGRDFAPLPFFALFALFGWINQKKIVFLQFRYGGSNLELLID